MNVVMIDDVDRTSVGYVCLWEGKISGSKLLHLFKSCYHMVGRSSEVLLSKYYGIRIESVKDNNGDYCVAVQVTDQTKTGTFQEICIYHGR